MESKNIVTVEHLNVSYTNRQKENREKEVLKDITFHIKKGEILGLLGESGCGKSTLARAMLGVERSITGSITHYSKMPQMIFQDPYSSLNPSKTIGWILEEPLRIKGGYTKQQRIERVESMLMKVGLDKQYAKHYPSQLSGGQRQRVCIGVALMLEPELLIADEAVSALDVTIQAQIMKLLLQLHEEMNLSILFISHDLRVVYQMSDRVMVMQNGTIVESGDIQQVYFDPQTEYMKKLLKAANIIE